LSAKDRLNRLLSLLSPEDSFAILINPDPDAMASALALKRLMWGRVKKVGIYRVTSISRPDNMAMVRLLRIPMKPLRELRSEHFNKYAIVDNQPSHHEGFQNREYSIVIDHHPKDPHTHATFLDIREEYGATSTILYEYLKAAKIKPSKKLATALFYGIKTDTKDLISSGQESDIKAFKDLALYADKGALKNIESSELTKQTLLTFKRALENMRFLRDTVFIYIDQCKRPDDLVIIADFFVKVVEVNWAIVAGTHGEKLIVILRYFGTRGDAGKKAKALFEPLGASAGGHKTAARAELNLQVLKSHFGEHLNLERFLIRLLRTGKIPEG